MTNGLLLWVDDEIEQLRAHIMFLEKKGYEIVTVSNGTDAIEQCRQRTFDLYCSTSRCLVSAVWKLCANSRR